METGTEKQDTLIKSVNGSYHNSTAIAYDVDIFRVNNNKLTLCFVHVLIVSSFQHTCVYHMESWALGVWIVKAGTIGERWIVSVLVFLWEVLIFILTMARSGNFSPILFQTVTILNFPL